MITGSHSDEEWERLMEEMGWAYDEEEVKPAKSMRRAAKERIIKKAIEEGTVIDLDKIYKDGKLFNYAIEHTSNDGWSTTRVTENGHEYIVSFRFEWLDRSLQVQGTPVYESPKVPKMIRLCTSLDTLLNLNGDLTDYAVKNTVDRIINEFERRYNNDL